MNQTIFLLWILASFKLFSWLVRLIRLLLHASFFVRDRLTGMALPLKNCCFIINTFGVFYFIKVGAIEAFPWVLLLLIIILHIRTLNVNIYVQFLFICWIVEHLIVHSNLRNKPRQIFVFLLTNDHRLVKSRFGPLAACFDWLSLKDFLALKVFFKLPSSVLILFSLPLISFTLTCIIWLITDLFFWCWFIFVIAVIFEYLYKVFLRLFI